LLCGGATGKQGATCSIIICLKPVGRKLWITGRHYSRLNANTRVFWPTIKIYTQPKVFFKNPVLAKFVKLYSAKT